MGISSRNFISYIHMVPALANLSVQVPALANLAVHEAWGFHDLIWIGFELKVVNLSIHEARGFHNLIWNGFELKVHSKIILLAIWFNFE